MRNYPGILANFVAGKFISAVAHAVETLNWMRDFCGNLQGDADVNAQGAITVDVSDPRHPVIRLAGKLPSGTGGGGGQITIFDNQNPRGSVTCKRVFLKAAFGCNVQFKVSDPNNSGDATLELGVYYS